MLSGYEAQVGFTERKFLISVIGQTEESKKVVQMADRLLFPIYGCSNAKCAGIY